MPSSISNSSDRTPCDPKGLSVVLIIVFFSLGLFGIEMFWRQRGHVPSVVDDLAWWAEYRNAASNQNPETIALLGASRMQLGFSTQPLQKRYPKWDVIPLAVDGKNPLVTLVDLSSDEYFVGLVVCSITARSFFSPEKNSQQEHVDYFHEQFFVSLDSRCNHIIRSQLQSRLVAIKPRVRLQDVLPLLLRGKGLPPRFYLTTFYDRFISADYTLLDISQHRQHRIQERKTADVRDGHPRPEEWLDGLSEIKGAVHKIQSRGGNVVFIRFPTTDEHWQLDVKEWPREIYWNQLSKLTNTVCIHFKDVPALANFDCPDTSHIDQRDKVQFTDSLLDELVRKEVLP